MPLLARCPCHLHPRAACARKYGGYKSGLKQAQNGGRDMARTWLAITGACHPHEGPRGCTVRAMGCLAWSHCPRDGDALGRSARDGVLLAPCRHTTRTEANDKVPVRRSVPGDVSQGPSYLCVDCQARRFLRDQMRGTLHARITTFKRCSLAVGSREPSRAPHLLHQFIPWGLHQAQQARYSGVVGNHVGVRRGPGGDVGQKPRSLVLQTKFRYDTQPHAATHSQVAQTRPTQAAHATTGLLSSPPPPSISVSSG